jgi:hypothetical protein
MISPNSKLAAGAIRRINRAALLLSRELVSTLLFICAFLLNVMP